MTKKEPKSDDHLSKFDWHDLSLTGMTDLQFFDLKLTPNSKPKTILETNKT